MTLSLNRNNEITCSLEKKMCDTNVSLAYLIQHNTLISLCPSRRYITSPLARCIAYYFEYFWDPELLANEGVDKTFGNIIRALTKVARFEHDPFSYMLAVFLSSFVFIIL